MIGQHYNCEHGCLHTAPSANTDFIVLTGGPGAGKTAVLEFVRKVFCKHVALLPEAAGVLFSGGFWRLDSISARKAAQRAIYHVQNEMQTLVRDEKKWMVGLCDRGTLDGLAYWPNSEEGFLKHLETTREKEYAKYRAVIHLRSPASNGGYNFQNPLRIETAEDAAIIDEKIHETWRDHPNYCTIESTTNFSEKIYKALHFIQLYLPEGCDDRLDKAKS